MKDYLLNISKELKNFSLSLDKTSILINKPWALLDDDNEIQKLIFKKNKELVLSKNGQVQMGKWDYFPEAKSLLIDRKTDSILCNEAFINEGVLILRMDGTIDKYFTLCNENLVPDLNAIKYLSELKRRKFNIKEYKTVNGENIEIHLSSHTAPVNGDKVVISGVEMVDGLFKLEDSSKFILVKKNTFSHLFTGKGYKDVNGQEFTIVQRWSAVYEIGDYVYLNDEISSFDEIYLSKKKINN